MIPYINTPFGEISTFTLMTTLAFLMLLFSTHISLRNANNIDYEQTYIFPKIIASAVIGFILSAIFDSIFKISINNGFKLSGIMFYGGLIGGCLCLYLLLKLRNNRSQYTVEQWFNMLTIPLIIFHIFGRLGCFMGGCCYGKYTNSFIGCRFPDNVENNIYHFGRACYPTQLFEVAALIIILAIVAKRKEKFKLYLICYSMSRFFIEFFRGDNRGFVFKHISPSQLISLLIILGVVLQEIIRNKIKSNE